LSRIIRTPAVGGGISIGEKHLDFKKESIAEQKLATAFPSVSVLTDPDGAKLIPVCEVHKFENVLDEKVHKARDEAHQQGYQQGLDEGLKQGQKVLQDLETAIADAITQREVLLEEAKRQVLQLVIEVSRKVTFGAVQVDPDITLAMISGVIDSLTDRSGLKIRVNPEHLPIVEQNIDRFLEGSTTIKEIKIESDPRVKFGGCFIETPTGDIDARLESQFEVIEEALLADGIQS